MSQTVPVQTEELRSAYDHWHASIGEEDHDHSPWHELVKQYLRPADVSGKRVLEIGCGRGGFSCWLARQRSPQGPELTAADFSAMALALAQAQAAREGLDGIRWHQEDIQHLSFADGGFDTVISCETIEHVADPRQAVRELARVLRPGGRLFLTTPNYLGASGLYRLYCRLRGRPWSEAGQAFAQWMFLPQTIRYVRQAGLRIEVVDAVGHWLPLPRRPIRLYFLDRARWLTRWTGHHSLVIGSKP
jgi:2-polyprenyl-6-hydroxyphenyl methylase/3-demethylubiquinone-9 3-methyltransferase